MRLPSQTPLSDFDSHVFPPTLRQLMKSCWIETLEEFLSVLGVLRQSKHTKPQILLEMEAILPALNRWLPTDALEVWLNGPIDAKPLGVECPEELLEQYKSMGSLRNDSVISPMTAPPLPTGFRLPVSFPLRDQGERGICVACTVADFTQFVTHSPEPLSVDHIYARCKSFDGYIDDEGADLQTALGVAGRFGICPERIWQTRSNSMELTPGDGENRFPRVGNIRPVLRGVIEDYKTKLTGADGNVPMPIPVCVLAFASTLCSQAAGLTGKWTLPLAGEAVLPSGHAMLIIGYQDDPSVPGGGYFIARNSWGEDYACDSPVDLPGHALLPYEYIRRFCFEAYTGPEMAEAGRGERGVHGATRIRSADSAAINVHTPKVAESEQVYIRKLDRDLRERITLRVLHAGEYVIAHPDEPNTFCAYSDSNWKKFVANGYAWDESRRQRNIFPDPDSEQEEYIESVKGVSARFQAAIAANLNDFESVPFPLAGGLFGSRPQKIDRVEKLADLSEELALSLVSVPEISQKSSIPNRWKSELILMSGMSVWDVCSGKKCCHVVVAFPVCAQFDVNKKPEFPAPNSNALDAILEQYDSWLARQKTRPD
ncbi:MAG: C1 family peptidase, partial [Thermoguttaceae bacterium]|nr:C1 family peptidase [Thermoguttaceae bacterium]